MTPILPPLADYKAYEPWRAEPSRWLPVASDIAHGHGLETASLHIFATGTNLVLGLGDELILKIFPPFLRGQFVSERSALAQLQGRLSIPIPQIMFAGERDGWPYLVITRLHDVAALIPLDRPVILTGEYIPENFLLSRDGNGWHLSGLFDFGDVMTGFGEYDLLGPSAFMAAGVKRRVRSLLEGYGYSQADINPALKRRLMVLLLLHRFSDLIRHIRLEGWQENAADLVELQELLWPT